MCHLHNKVNVILLLAISLSDLNGRIPGSMQWYLPYCLSVCFYETFQVIISFYIPNWIVTLNYGFAENSKLTFAEVLQRILYIDIRPPSKLKLPIENRHFVVLEQETIPRTSKKMNSFLASGVWMSWLYSYRVGKKSQNG